MCDSEGGTPRGGGGADLAGQGSKVTWRYNPVAEKAGEGVYVAADVALTPVLDDDINASYVSAIFSNLMPSVPEDGLMVQSADSYGAGAL